VLRNNIRAKRRLLRMSKGKIKRLMLLPVMKKKRRRKKMMIN
jgi:hypothetical protein